MCTAICFLRHLILFLGINYYNLSYPTRYNDSGNLFIPRTRTEFGKKSIKVYGLALFNDLPLEIKECRDLSMFKRKLKKWIIHGIL